MQTQMTLESSTSVLAAVAQSPVPPIKVAPAPVVQRINRVNLKTFIDSQDGLFVSVDFKKLDGTKRTLTGRLGVKSYLKGGVNTVEADSRPYLTMFDVAICQYRTVSLDTVSEIRASSKVYQVID